MALLKVTARMEAPVVLRDALHLDALLESAHPHSSRVRLTRRTPLDQLPRIPIPVLHWDGVALCSAAQLPDGAQRGTEYITARPDGVDLGRMAGKVNRKSGPGKDQMIRLPLVYTPELVWYTWSSRGKDSDRSPRRAVRGLVRRLKVLGSHRRGGYGRVGAWVVEHMPGGTPMDAVHSGSRALRHLPARWCEWAARESPVACSGPYWHPGRREQGVPEGTPCTLAERTLDKLHEAAGRSRESVCR
jgi:hypothetical protein